jgi:exodeoxyribonuclease (lambda-induced)
MNDQQRTYLWGQERIGKFTASEIYKLMGKPKKGFFTDTALSYIMDKVAEIIKGECEMSPDTYATVWGIEHEPEALSWYEKLSGSKVELVGFVPYNENSGASPDSLVGLDGMVEVKCPYATRNHLNNCLLRSSEDFKNHKPEHYWQMMMGMMSAGREWCHFISYDPRLPLSCGYYQFTLFADENEFKLLQDKISLAVEKRDELLAIFMPKTTEEDGFMLLENGLRDHDNNP